MAGQETTEDSDRATRDYEDKVAQVLTRIVRVGAVSQATIIVGALIMGAALLYSSRQNRDAIAALDQKLSARLLDSRCQCDLREMRATANAGNVTIFPDINSPGQHAREILFHQGKLNDLSGTTAAAGRDQRAD